MEIQTVSSSDKNTAHTGQENKQSAQNKPQKTVAQLEKEAKKKAAKEAKLAKLQEKVAAQEKEATKSNAAGDARKSQKKEKKAKDVIIYDVPTAEGEKKDTLCPLPTVYSPSYVEATWYSWWQKSGFFKPEYQERRKRRKTADRVGGTFTIVIPPPNVTGTLHVGHAMATSIEDTLTRWHRMKGERSLFNPGCDHAGIATQVVVEKKLWRENQLTRHDVGREKFVEHVWKWKEEKGMTIYEQLKALGSSVDWDRACFTMDPKMCTAVTEAFVRLHESGLIYRSTRLVNWSCALRSAISDIEVDKRELAGRMMLSVPGYDHKVEFGVLVSFAYPIYNSGEEVVVATTRVETMLGDTAVAVHPDDHRYRHLIGKLCKHPFVDRDLPIVADAFVDKDFGTGCVKVTPAHDHNDYEVGLRHKLPFVTCIGDDGLMTKHCGPFSGLPRFEARKRVLEALKLKALYRDCVDNPMVVPICNRSKDVVEPMLKPQWYVDCQQMAKRAIEVVNSGELTLIPEVHVKTWITWMEGIRDWCISRQLWWGHRIPAYFVESKNLAIPNGDAADSNYWVSGRTVEEAVEKAAQRFDIAKENVVLKQDEDVLDTWFSSALFPFSVFDWPNGGKSFDVHYPTNVLETAHDILFFWVARMVFFGQELTGKLPFKQVYLHPIIRDAHGRKMSKSLGNVVDPIDVVRGVTLAELYRKLEDGNLDPRYPYFFLPGRKPEVETAKAGQKKDFPDGIPECGTDALRFALLAYTGQGRDINLDVLRIQGYRHFSNKIWQGTRFVLNQLGKDYQPCREFELSGCESASTCWIAGRMSLAVRLTNEALNSFNFTAATTAVYNFWLYDFCDVYLEYAKAVIQQSDNYYAKDQCRQMLFSCVDCGLRLISPFMPYLSEELWQRLPRRDKALTEPSICVESYPSVDDYHYEDVKLFDRVDLAMSIVRTIRSLRSDYELTAKTKTDRDDDLEIRKTAKPMRKKLMWPRRRIVSVFVECVDKGTLTELSDLVELIRTLTSSNHLTLFAVGKQKAPLGCAIVTVSASCKAHLLLQGIIDLEKEMNKLNEQKAKVAGQLEKLEESMTKSDYEVKVPLPVRTVNTEKLAMKMTCEKSLMLKYNFLAAELIETEKHLVLKIGRDQQNEDEHGDAADSGASMWKRFQELKAVLNSLKGKTLATDEWRRHTVFTNPAGLVVKSVRRQLNPDMCTQAWCKFAEILICFPDLLPKSDCTFRSLHLCEAPGGFISALNQRLQNLGFDVSWDWFANSLNPFVVSAMKVEDWNLTLIEETRDRWLFGPDQTGDIFKWEVFCDLRDRFASERFNLVTADGSFDCRQAPADQELATFPLQFCEVVSAFHLLRPGGAFVLKKFTTFETFSVRLLYLLYCVFEQVDLFKPLTSKAGNSEVYVICRRFLGLDDSMLAKLTVGYGRQDALELSSMLEELVDVVPEKFVSLVYESSAHFTKCQSEMIQFNVDSFHLLRYTDEFAVDDSRLKSFIDESKVAVLEHYWAKLDRMLGPIRDSERLVQHFSSSRS